MFYRHFLIVIEASISWNLHLLGHSFSHVCKVALTSFNRYCSSIKQIEDIEHSKSLFQHALIKLITLPGPLLHFVLSTVGGEYASLTPRVKDPIDVDERCPMLRPVCYPRLVFEEFATSMIQPLMCILFYTIPMFFSFTK